MKSTSGFCFKHGSGALSWCFKKQNVVAQSSTEVEFIVATTVVNMVEEANV